MNYRRRLDKVAAAFGTMLPCHGCRDRQGVLALVIFAMLPGGQLVCLREPPPPCAACGQGPEQIIAVIEEVVAAPDPAATEEAP